MKGLDEWIAGGNGHVDTCEFECENKHKWEVSGYTEYGSFDPDDESQIDCPICGKPDQGYEY